MNRPDDIEVAYPRWFAAAALWLWLPMLAFIILVILASGAFGIFSAHSRTSLDLLAYAQPLLIIGVGVWMGGSFIHWVRDRHAFQSRYVLSDKGVLVQARGIEDRFCSWSEFDACIDSRLGRYIELRSSTLPQPVTLMFGTPGSPRVSPTAKLELARQLTREKLGSKCERTWW